MGASLQFYHWPIPRIYLHAVISAPRSIGKLWHSADNWLENIAPLAFPALQSPIIGSLSVCLQSVSAQRWFVAVSLCVCPWLPQTATDCHKLPQPAIACHRGPKQTATACKRGSEFWDPLSSTTASSKQWHAWISSYQRLQCISYGIDLVFWTKTPCFEGM